MPTPIASNGRSESTVFADLQSLCTSPGYIHAIAFFCWRDNIIRYSGSQIQEKDLTHQFSEEKLLRTEIATLIGLLVQRPIDLSLPAPSNMQTYIDRTESLLHELHQALMRPWFEGWDVKRGEIPDNDPFTNAAALREPIFYAGESAYNFQYQSLAKLKYQADNPWLNSNKGFPINEACLLAKSLGELQLRRQNGYKGSLRKLHPDKWTILPAFSFTSHELIDASGLCPEKVERFLDAFCIDPNDRNPSFTSLSEFNVTNSAPILRVADRSYVLLQHYSLLEALYETPFFWMASDKAYFPTAVTNRGRFTEDFVSTILEAIFGTDRVWRNVDIYKGRNRVTEADAMVLYGDRAIVVQAKSKRLTIEARKGNDLQLKSDFKKAIQDAYDQAVLCSEALSDVGYKFVAPDGTDISIPHTPRIIFPICIVSDHYPALAFQARQFLKLSVTSSIQAPLVTDVFALDVIAEMLNTPLQFLNYLALRARFGEKLSASQELTILGCHLKQNLWLDGDYNLVHLGNDFTGALDIAMLARRAGAPGKKTPNGILTRFDGLTIGRLFSEIERIGSVELTGLGLLLLQLSSETVKFFNRGIDRIVRGAKGDGQNHDISVAIDEGSTGITIHCNDLPEIIARERLSAHCKLRKYDVRADSWYGLLLEPSTSGVRGALVIEEAWATDPKMESLMEAWPKRQPTPISQLTSKPQKIGRNAPCPCGSGKKYKRCCLNS